MDLSIPHPEKPHIRHHDPERMLHVRILAGLYVASTFPAALDLRVAVLEKALHPVVTRVNYANKDNFFPPNRGE